MLELAVYLHVHVTRQWLLIVAAPDDLLRRVVFLARHLAERDEVTTLGIGRVRRGRHAARRWGLRAGPGEAAAAMDAAAELVGEPGETDPLGFEFGPTNVGFRRVHLALGAGAPDRAVSIAEGLHPERNPFPANRVYYWVGYGRALARLRGRRHDAVRALRRAETMNPLRVRRDPLVRDTIAVLLPGARRDAVGRELRGMAYRAGLPV